MKYITVFLSLAMFTTGASAQTVKDIHGDVMPATATPVEATTWQSIRLRVPEHRVDNMLYFSPDGILRVEYTRSKKGVDGRWSLQPGKLCLQLPVRGNECFDYPRTLQIGETVSVTSDRGWTGSVTMLTDATGTSLAQSTPAGAGIGN